MKTLAILVVLVAASTASVSAQEVMPGYWQRSAYGTPEYVTGYVRTSPRFGSAYGYGTPGYVSPYSSPYQTPYGNYNGEQLYSAGIYGGYYMQPPAMYTRPLYVPAGGGSFGVPRRGGIRVQY